jgi:hypothetical protein
MNTLCDEYPCITLHDWATGPCILVNKYKLIYTSMHGARIALTCTNAPGVGRNLWRN